MILLVALASPPPSPFTLLRCLLAVVEIYLHEFDVRPNDCVVCLPRRPAYKLCSCVKLTAQQLPMKRFQTKSKDYMRNESNSSSEPLNIFVIKTLTESYTTFASIIPNAFRFHFEVL